jgi:L-asparagine transporter-like permease
MSRRKQNVVLVASLLLGIVLTAVPIASPSSCSAFSLVTLGPFCAAEQLQSAPLELSELPDAALPKTILVIAAVITVFIFLRQTMDKKSFSFFLYHQHTEPKIFLPLKRLAENPCLIASRDA